MRTPHNEHFGENSISTLERRWEVLVKMREQETICQRFDNALGIRKTERQNTSMSVPDCPRSPAQDFLRITNSRY